jgi:Family of unknown function (DUF6131)
VEASRVIILGVICVIAGLLIPLPIVVTIGIILIVVGIVLYILGRTGHAVGGRSHYW